MTALPTFPSPPDVRLPLPQNAACPSNPVKPPVVVSTVNVIVSGVPCLLARDDERGEAGRRVGDERRDDQAVGEEVEAGAAVEHDMAGEGPGRGEVQGRDLAVDVEVQGEARRTVVDARRQRGGCGGGDRGGGEDRPRLRPELDRTVSGGDGVRGDVAGELAAFGDRRRRKGGSRDHRQEDDGADDGGHGERTTEGHALLRGQWWDASPPPAQGSGGPQPGTAGRWSCRAAPIRSAADRTGPREAYGFVGLRRRHVDGLAGDHHRLGRMAALRARPPPVEPAERGIELPEAQERDQAAGEHPPQQ